MNLSKSLKSSQGTEDWPNGPDTYKPEQCAFLEISQPAINKDVSMIS